MRFHHGVAFVVLIAAQVGLSAEAAQPEAPPLELKDIQELRRLAESAAAEEEAPSAVPEEKPFELKGLSLQALNPEISVTGDMVGRFRHQGRIRERAKFLFRSLGIHFQSYLDPYSRFKAAVPATSDGVELEEAYVTRFAVLPGVAITAGRFRQRFGVVNRWHRHALDQVDFPLALKDIFGEEGLRQTGVSIAWTMPPSLGASQELVLQVTNGENDRLFSGNTLSTPACLVRYHRFRDITPDLYIDWGGTALVGWNRTWDVLNDPSDPAAGTHAKKRELSTRVFGVDLTLLWEPTSRMRYRNIVWRTEGYVLNRDLLAPDDGRRDSILAWGLYTYVQSRVSRTWEVGVRFDYYKPAAKGYANLLSDLYPLVRDDAKAHRCGINPYVLWRESEFVWVRLGYSFEGGRGMGSAQHMVFAQVIFAAGPHKHERY